MSGSRGCCRLQAREGDHNRQMHSGVQRQSAQLLAWSRQADCKLGVCGTSQGAMHAFSNQQAMWLHASQPTASQISHSKRTFAGRGRPPQLC